MLQKLILPCQAIMKSISDSFIGDSKTAIAVAFTFGYFVDTILRKTILKRLSTSTHNTDASKRMAELEEEFRFDVEYQRLHLNEGYDPYEENTDYDDEDDDDDDGDDIYSDEYQHCNSDNNLLKYEEYKMVLAINSSLKMGKGKVAAQCAHAALAAYRIALTRHPSILKYWERTGQAKITVKADDDSALVNIMRQAKKANLITNITHDAGRTQIEAGSKTVCVIGPGPSRLIDEITGKLKLY